MERHLVDRIDRLERQLADAVALNDDVRRQLMRLKFKHTIMGDILMWTAFLPVFFVLLFR